MKCAFLKLIYFLLKDNCCTEFCCFLSNLNMNQPQPQVYIYLGEGNGTPLQYSCLENPMDRGAWQAAVHGVAKSRARLSDSLSLFTFMHWRRKWQPTPVFLPGESQGWQSLVGCRLWGRTELDTTEATQQQQQQGFSTETIMQSSYTVLLLPF